MPIIAGCAWYTNDPEITDLVNNMCRITTAFSKDNPTIIESTFYKVISCQRKYDAKGEKIIPFSNNKGIIAGRIHSSTQAGIIDTISFNQKCHTAIIESNGEWLSQNYWGSYVCILADHQKQKFHLFRDPSGLCPFYFLTYKGALFFSTDLAILHDALGWKGQIDWEYFASYVIFSDLMSRRTPFSQVYELLPAEHLTYSKAGYDIDFYWSPHKFVKSRKLENISEQISDLLIDSVKKWTQESSAICLYLSGGLDSTSLLLSLKEVLADKQILIGLNYFNPEIASSNEAPYAKEIAKQCGVELLEFDISKAASLSSPNEPRCRWNKPNSTSINEKRKQEMSQLVRNYGNIEFVDGFGGDQLFIANVTKASLTDYLLEKGMKGFRQKLIDACFINRQSATNYTTSALMNLIYFNYKTKHLHRNEPEWFHAKFASFVNADVFLHPNWKNFKNISPGKFGHMFSIYQGAFYTEHGVNSYLRPVIYPYLSQPLIELALSIPTYETYENGYSRSIFRKAIAERFNTDMVWRKSKGETSGIFQLGLRNNMKRALELCLEGRFAREGLLIKDNVYKDIRTIERGLTTYQWPLINLIASELWFEAWGYQ